MSCRCNDEVKNNSATNESAASGTFALEMIDETEAKPVLLPEKHLLWNSSWQQGFPVLCQHLFPAYQLRLSARLSQQHDRMRD
jgi:hypothetical protein